MKEQKKNQKGITLIALVISIIIMLILAGVSLNAMIGDNGIVTRAKQSSFSHKIASYQEEMEMNIVGIMKEDNFDERGQVTVLGESVRKYIPSLKEEDVNLFGIVSGELYYTGEDELQMQVAKDLKLKVKPEEVNIDEFVNEVEGKAIEKIVQQLGGDAFKNSENNSLGVQLFDKNLANANKWKIITEVTDGSVSAIYGTGWYYVERGKEVEGIGILNNNYIINYDIRKAVQFDANKHSMMGFDSTVGVTGNLIFNIDPSAIEKGNSESFGTGVTFIGYKNDFSDAFTTSEFIFDGVDDEIRIEYDNNQGKQDIINNGLTYEFYGTWTEGNHYKNDGTLYTRTDGACGLLEFGQKDTENLTLRMQMGFYPDNQNHFGFSFSGLTDANHDYKESATLGAGGNNWIAYPEVIPNNSPYYATMVFLPNDVFEENGKEYFKNQFYLNGILSAEGKIEKGAWESFQNSLNNANEIRIGMFHLGGWSREYSKMNCYTMRIYSKALSKNEVVANYNAAVSYHQFLLNNGNASTEGDTGGNDF